MGRTRRSFSKEFKVEAVRLLMANGCSVARVDRDFGILCQAFQALLKVSGIQCSMSRKRNCWNNAVAEKFFHTFTVELSQGSHYHTRQEARTEIFKYIDVFYNRQRRHPALCYLTPDECEKQAIAA